jgi:hypothetical protein
MYVNHTILYSVFASHYYLVLKKIFVLRLLSYHQKLDKAILLGMNCLKTV